MFQARRWQKKTTSHIVTRSENQVNEMRDISSCVAFISATSMCWFIFVTNQFGLCDLMLFSKIPKKKKKKIVLLPVTARHSCPCIHGISNMKYECGAFSSSQMCFVIYIFDVGSHNSGTSASESLLKKKKQPLTWAVLRVMRDVQSAICNTIMPSKCATTLIAVYANDSVRRR